MRTTSLRPFASARSSRRLVRTLLRLAIVAGALASAEVARADGFARPPHDDGVAVPIPDGDRYDDYDNRDPEPFPPLPISRSSVRVAVGPVGKLDADSASPGLLAAIDFGRGPTGFRLTGAWLSAGNTEGLAQYTGEITVDFGGASRVRPVIGAGAGVARTSSSLDEDGNLVEDEGAYLGIGVVRGGISVLLPLAGADARLGVDVTGAIPAVVSDRAPSSSPWVLGAVTIAVGF